MDKAFQHSSYYVGNFYDVETKEFYWISGIKKTGTNRHWAGGGHIQLDRTLVDEYLRLTNQKEIDKNLITLVDIPEIYPVDRIEKVLKTSRFEENRTTE